MEAGFYSDVVECLPLDPVAQVRFPSRAVGIFLHPVSIVLPKSNDHVCICYMKFLTMWYVRPIAICNWTPPPEKSWTPWKFWTVLLHRILESYGLMIVFFEKAMITGIPLQNQLRTYKIEEKTTSELFFSQSGLDPPHPPPQNPTKISWIRAWIYVIVVGEKRYRS